jgi:hypothetical protein
VVALPQIPKNYRKIAGLRPYYLSETSNEARQQLLPKEGDIREREQSCAQREFCEIEILERGMAFHRAGPISDKPDV